MVESSKPIIKYIPDLLDYCQKKGLSINTQENYKRFLKKFIKKTTQNYYLIALRALLSYFSAKDIDCLPADKIGLPKVEKTEKDWSRYLNSGSIEKIIELKV